MFPCIHDILRYYAGMKMIDEEVIKHIENIIDEKLYYLVSWISERYGFDGDDYYKFSSFELLSAVASGEIVEASKGKCIRKYMMGLERLVILVDEDDISRWMNETCPELDCDEEGCNMLRIFCSYLISDIAVSCGEITKNTMKIIDDKVLRKALKGRNMLYISC